MVERLRRGQLWWVSGVRGEGREVLGGKDCGRGVGTRIDGFLNDWDSDHWELLAN